MSGIDVELFLEAKRSKALNAEFEKLSAQLSMHDREVEDARVQFVTEKERLENTLIGVESCKDETVNLESQLDVTLDSIKSLQQVLQEVHETTAKLAESEREHNSILQNLEKDNYYCQMKIPSLEEKIRAVYEEAKLTKLEKQAGEEDLKRQREEGLDQLILLQRDCEQIRTAIKEIEKEINMFEIDEGVTRATFPLARENGGSHAYASPGKHNATNSNKRSFSPIRMMTGIDGLNDIIANLVDCKIGGLQEMVKEHVEKRFHSLEKDLYARSVQYPVYKGQLPSSIDIPTTQNSGNKPLRKATLTTRKVIPDKDSGISPNMQPKQPAQPMPSKSIDRSTRFTLKATIANEVSDAVSSQEAEESHTDKLSSTISSNSRWSDQMRALIDARIPGNDPMGPTESTSAITTTTTETPLHPSHVRSACEDQHSRRFIRAKGNPRNRTKSTKLATVDA